MSAQAAPQQKPETSRAVKELDADLEAVLAHYSSRVTAGDMVAVLLREMNKVLLTKGALTTYGDVAGLMSLLGQEFDSLAKIIVKLPVKAPEGPAPGVS